MRSIFLLTVFSTLTSMWLYSQDIDGTWQAQLETSMGDIQISLSITTSPLSAKISSSAGIDGMSVQELTFHDQVVRFVLPSFGVTYVGKLDGDFIRGKWRQGNQEVDLDFTRSNQVSTLATRKQTPVQSEGYQSIEIEFRSSRDSVLLSGTLTVPEGEGPFPAAILLSVAGGNDRDQSHSRGHKPFLVLADYLSKNGIAVLRYDDRGVGGSEGLLLDCDFSTLTDDALTAFDFLSAGRKIDPTRIGFIGNSEGSVIGGMCAVKRPEVAFTIMLGAVGVPLQELFVDRLDRMNAMYGLTQLQKKELVHYSEALHKILANKNTVHEKRTEIELLNAENTLDKPGFPNYLFFLPSTKPERMDFYLTPWYRAQATYDPQSVLPNITTPILVINGSLDLFQSPELNFPPIQKALFEANNNYFVLVVAPNVNHVMQDAKTGLPTEYVQNENTVSVIILETILSWIKTRFGHHIEN